MLTCRLQGPLGAQRLYGPVDVFRFIGGELFASTRTSPVARYVDRLWEHDGLKFTHLEFDGPLELSFRDPRSSWWQRVHYFHYVRFADGVLHAPVGPLVALRAPDLVWQDLHTATVYREISLLPQS
jgi:hypothetical protein